MKVKAFKTPIVKKGDDIFKIIKNSINQIPENSILVVASKILATSEGRFIKKTTTDKSEKHKLVKKEADLYTDPHSSKYNLMLTIKDNWMFVNAGIDESNADGQYLLWPKNPQQWANDIWEFIKKEYKVKKIGVTISDSKSMPLNWGVTGHAIAHCGFFPLKSYIGKPDIFGRELEMEQVNIMQSVTVAAVYKMGEGNEQTPLGLVSQLSDIDFQDHIPTNQELANLKIKLEDDAYYPILGNTKWKKGGGGI